MSWLFSQALVAAYSEATCSDGEQSVPSSGHHTQQAYLSPDKMTDFSRLSRFGMTFKPLTDDLGMAVLTWCQEDSRVKTSQQQGGGQELTAQEVACGNTWQGSWVKYDPDTSSWKTRQCSLLGDLEEFSGTWPRWGSMLNGECWELRTWALRTREIESGSPDGKTFFHTPNCSGLDGGSNSRKALKKRQMLPTPVARDHRSPGRSRMERTGSKSGDPLPQVVGGTLNPTWVEWLMGWPLGWTDLKPLEMDKFQQWQQQHGAQ